MKPEDLTPQLQLKIDRAIANGLNTAANRALVDIETHVRVRSGRLRASYAITKRAMLGQLRSEVGSPLDYRLEQYPYENKPRTNSGELLAEDGFKGVAQAEAQKAIAREFQ